MKNILSYIILILAVSVKIKGQVGIGTPNPSTNSVLEVSSTDKGILLMRNNITNTTSPAPLSAHVQGIITYNLSNSNDVSEGLYQNNGIQWTKLSYDYPYGTISNSLATTDNNGWYLLNGRAVSSLPANVQSRAVSLGFATNLPNADDRFIKTKDTSETLGLLSGSSTIALTQANLPNVTFMGSTNSAGDHSHTYIDRGSGTTTNSGTGPAGMNPEADDTVGTYTTGTSGNHSHQVSMLSGGSSQPVNINPSYLVTNVFIYLGN
ncbi:hypothetical protein ACQWU4_14885 [Chryseobacterium sp. MIQD13]|uniref:hypothetical protein n=1 Tax=Chryseobacterium sp. MIQD13 TaxID=3422310 RepID=UPI003D2BCBB6